MEIELCGMALCLETGLSAALEMRDAYRSFQLEAFCVGRSDREAAGLRADKGQFFGVINSYLRLNLNRKVGEGGWGMNKNT